MEAQVTLVVASAHAVHVVPTVQVEHLTGQAEHAATGVVAS